MYSVNVLNKRSNKKNRKFRRDISKILGFKPKDISLYILALTHKSVQVSPVSDSYGNNERLEFLGDAVLDAVVSELLYNRFPSADEGFMTKMRVRVVNGKHLARMAKDIGLNKLLIANAGKNPSFRIYEDALEAFIGAIQIDRGYKFVKKFIYQKLFVQYIDLNELKHKNENYKSRLIEWSQKKKRDLKLITEPSAIETDKFICKVLIENELFGKGKAGSKKEAEQKASMQALEELKKQNRV
ncbi:MAG: ribonuclease III [Bacteroidota bacterium]|nr:ribonuclease III [Bacteroidota bacterium]